MVARYPGNSAFVEARNYTHVEGSNGIITRIVIHDMESPEKGDTAELCAQYFATTTKQASAHFTIDNNSVVQCVDLDRRAWHAPPNMGSIGLEHAGYATQDMTSWLDPFGKSMLAVSAKVTAWLCKTYNIPVRKLSASDLRNGMRGICGHVDVSDAFHQSDHRDPGLYFPWDYYLNLVRVQMGQPTADPGAGGYRVPKTKEDMVHDVQVALHVSPVDHLWGNTTDRAVSAMHEMKDGIAGSVDTIKLAQRCVGVPDDGDWGPLSSAAFDVTVRALQGAWRFVMPTLAVDGDWGPSTEMAYAVARQTAYMKF